MCKKMVDMAKWVNIKAVCKMYLLRLILDYANIYTNHKV